jgi:hypothetical protein
MLSLQRRQVSHMFPLENRKAWRIINLILILAGLVMPWVDIGFEVRPVILQGWEIFYKLPISYLIQNEIEVPFVFDLIPGLCGIFLLYYITFSTININNFVAKNKFIFTGLVLTVAIFLFLFITFREHAQAFMGLYIFSSGIISATLLELHSLLILPE